MAPSSAYTRLAVTSANPYVEPKLAGVVAVDLEAKRLVRVRENLERLGLSAELIVQLRNGTVLPLDDRLLIDR